MTFVPRRLAPLLWLAAFGPALALTSGCVSEAEHLEAKGNVLLRQGSVAGALTLFRAAAAQAPPHEEGLLRLGNALFRAQRFAEAEAAYGRARVLAKDACTAERPLAQLFAQQGRLDAAESTLFSCLTRKPDDLDARLALGLIRLDRGDLASAGAAFDAVLMRSPRHPAALYARARLALHKGQLAEADELFVRLEKAQPRKPYGSYGRGVVATRRRAFEQACMHLRRAQAHGLSRHVWEHLRSDRQLANAASLPCLSVTWGEAG